MFAFLLALLVTKVKLVIERFDATLSPLDCILNFIKMWENTQNLTSCALLIAEGREREREGERGKRGRGRERERERGKEGGGERESERERERGHLWPALL